MLETKQYGDLTYLLMQPSGYDERATYPVIIFMHGAGARGDDTDKLRTNPFFTLAMPYIKECIIIAPLCRADTWFDLFEQVLDFCTFVSEHKNTDKNRIYLIGNSMGGYAVWQMAMSRPELFAGVIPICGGGMYWNAPRLKHIPIWAFHGRDDSCVSVDESMKMVERVSQCGGHAKLTVYENTGHDAWTATYQNPAVFQWLLSHSKDGAAAARTALDDVGAYG